MKQIAPICLLVALAGCSSLTKPVTIQQALSSIESDLISAKALTISPSTLSNGVEMLAFDNAVLGAQCSQDKADPDVPLITESVRISLTGTFSAGATLSIVGVGGTPTGGISGTVDRGKTQQVSIPVAFVALSEVPTTLEAEHDEDTGKLPAADKAAHEAIESTFAAALASHVNTLIGGFTYSACSQAQIASTAPALMTSKAPK